MINANNPSNWKPDIEKSLELYNDWFMKFALKTFRDSRAGLIDSVKNVFDKTQNHRSSERSPLLAR